MNNIRKFGIIAAFLAVVTILVPLPARLDTAFASETASDAIIQEARNEAEKLLAVRSAVWLKFLDEWNAYLEERESDPDLPAPVFSSFIPLDGEGLLRLDVLLDKEGAPGYLPASFPIANYNAVSLGNEIEVTVTPSNAVSATYVPNFLPMAEVSEGTVKLKITRPGASPEFGFFVEKNAANEMGSAGTLEWVDEQGKIAVNKLESNIIRSQAGGEIDFESTVKFGTIEGRDGESIYVANTLDLGGSDINNIRALNAGSGTFTGELSAGELSAADGKFTVSSTGDLNAGSGKFTGELSAADGKFTVSSTGDLNAGSGTFTEGTFTEGLSAAGGKFTVNSSTGAIDTGSGNITTTGSVTTGSLTIYKDEKTGAAGSLTINGKTGDTSATAYDVWVKNADNAITLNGTTLSSLRQEIRDNAPSGPSGFPTATAIQNKSSGNTTLNVTSGKWYKIQMRSGAAGGKGVRMTFYLKSTSSTTWNINFYTSSWGTAASYSKTGELGGTAVEIKSGSTIIAILGGGGGSYGKYGRISNTVNMSTFSTIGGDAGVPAVTGGAKAGGDAKTESGTTLKQYAPPSGAGGAASPGTKNGINRGGSGYSAGEKFGGGGSSYINPAYITDKTWIFEETPVASTNGTPLISIWVYNN